MEKYRADETFEKIKSSLVTRGHQQDWPVFVLNRTVYVLGSSPTAATSSVFTIALIAAAENCFDCGHLGSLDSRQYGGILGGSYAIEQIPV